MNKPVMILQCSSPEPQFDQFFNLQTRDAYLLRIDGTVHFNFGEIALLPHIPSGTLDNRRATQIIHAYLLSFFNKHLKGEDDHLLDGPSPDYPEADPFLRK